MEASSRQPPPVPPWSASCPATSCDSRRSHRVRRTGPRGLPPSSQGHWPRLPDALAYTSTAPGGAIALLGGGRALTGPVGLSSWSPLVTAAALGRLSPSCGVNGLDGATLMPGGAPLIATGCRRSGHVGLFTRTSTSWKDSGVTLGGSLREATTTVLRVQSTAATTIVLAVASLRGRQSLVALWRSGSAPWTVAAPLTLSSGSSVRSTAVNSAGDVAVLFGVGTGRMRNAIDIAPGGIWNRLPRLPARTTALALPGGALTFGQPAVNAFSVAGESLDVFSLTPAGTAWARIQSSRIPLAYGSSG